MVIEVLNFAHLNWIGCNYIKCKNINEKYKYNFQAIFPDIKFQIISFNTHARLRSQQLEDADLIVYTCGSQEEVDKLVRPIEIGKNEWHHDYNQLHSDKYQAKTINLIFNYDVNQYYTNSCESLKHEKYFEKTIITNTDVQFPLIQTEYSNIITHHLKLPAENMKFISYIFPSNESYSKLTCRKKYEFKTRPVFMIFTSLILIYKKLVKTFKGTHYLKHGFELYTKYSIQKTSDEIARKLNKYLSEYEK